MRQGTDIDGKASPENDGSEAVPVFVAFAIEQYAHAKGIDAVVAADMLSEHGVLEHLIEFYDVMHLHGHRWLVQEIDRIIDSKRK